MMMTARFGEIYYLLRDDATQTMTDKYDGSPHFLADISELHFYDESYVLA